MRHRATSRHSAKRTLIIVREALEAVDDEVGGSSWVLNGFVVVFRGHPPGDPANAVLTTRARTRQPDLAWSVHVDGEVPETTHVPSQQVDALQVAQSRTGAPPATRRGS
jgi:hypothetical protein